MNMISKLNSKLHNIWKQLALCAALFVVPTGYAANPEIQYPTYSVKTVDGLPVVCDYKGKPMLKIGKMGFKWSPPVAVPVKVEKTAPDTFRITYSIYHDDSGKITVEGTLKALPYGHIKLNWLLDAPASVNTGGIMQVLLQQHGIKKSNYVYKSGLWTRDANGGIPFEARDGYFRSFKNGNSGLWLLLGGNANYSNPWNEHLGLTKNKAGKQEGSMEFLVGPPELDDYTAIALFHKRPVGMRLSTDRPFNLWESGVPEVKVEISNPYKLIQKNIAFSIIGRNYDGTVVQEKTKLLTLKPYETARLSYKLPESKREIYFVEAKAVVPGKKEVFSRTNLAILPPYEFEHTGESKFALSAYFAIPSQEAVFKLMKRMGVHILRNGDNRVSSKYDIISFCHGSVGPNDSPEKVAQGIDAILARAAERQNPELEFCNEWNMIKGDEKSRRAALYVEYLRVLKAKCDKKYPTLKIIGIGMAGADTGFLKLIAENGAIPLMDGGVALHPGRGNMTPDYTGNGWTYLGGIRRFRKAMNELGIKQLHLSEVYACTNPNNSWNDSYRQATENVILTYAIGLAEDAATIQFYQLHDSVWHDLGGVNPNNSEYHFGLLMRDGTIKPSLLAYATVAEALDGAKCTGYLDFGDKVYGIGFATPRGPLAIVYDRTDGYFLNKREKKYAMPEPWVDSWETHRKKTFDTVGNRVTVIDPIGRSRTIKAKNGRVEIILDGAPLIVYGINFKQEVLK